MAKYRSLALDDITREQAIAFDESGTWKKMTDRERAEFQLLVERLCMPFDVFHASIEACLGRPVFTHEFGFNRDGLIDELIGDGPSPSLTDIFEMIPEDKRVIFVGRE